MSQYVCVRIPRMDDVDVALFERDWNNTLYYFILNSDEQIYMRYGGRDARGPLSYLDLNSLELALQKGLELHAKYRKGELKKTERPKPVFPREIPPLVERTFARNQCVECHLIGDFQLVYREQTGKLDKLNDMFRWPDIRTIGIELDVPKGLVVKETRDAVQAAGMKPGDRIAALNGTPVWTFGDLQYTYDKVPRTAKQVALTVDRGGQPVDLTVSLPERWWLTDLRFRQLSVDPRAEFESRPLSEAEKRKYDLKPDGFASQVTRIGGFAEMLKVHELKTGDIVYAVDGVDRDDAANTPELFIKLRKNAGDTLTLDVIRDGKRLKMPVRTQRMYFRK
jgi:Trypsin-like serine proteases, typically periplasmic, contain C-terminal PDZ domain